MLIAQGLQVSGRRAFHSLAMPAEHGQCWGALALSRGPSPLEPIMPLLGGEMLHPLPSLPPGRMEVALKLSSDLLSLWVICLLDIKTSSFTEEGIFSQLPS